MNLDILKLEIPSQEVLTALKEHLFKYSNNLDFGIDESKNFIFENCVYGLKFVEQTDWEDDGRGKYFYCDTIMQLYNEDNNKGYNCFITQEISRTGSYYTHWDYFYEDAIIKIAKEKIIPEQIIPQHAIVELV